MDQHGQVIDVLANARRDQASARRFFARALSYGRRPVEVTTDKAPVYPRILDELLPGACHVDTARENNRIEADHGRLKARLRPMRGLKRLRSVQTISAGHVLIQNIRRGHYDLATGTDPRLRLAAAFTELAAAVWPPPTGPLACPASPKRNRADWNLATNREVTE